MFAFIISCETEIIDQKNKKSNNESNICDIAKEVQVPLSMKIENPKLYKYVDQKYSDDIEDFDEKISIIEQLLKSYNDSLGEVCSTLKSLYKKQQNSLNTKVEEEKKKSKWEIKYYVDEFGDKTENGYVFRVIDDGLFSNSATSNSKLSVKFLIEPNELTIMLLEYGSNYVKGSQKSPDNYEVALKISDQKYLFKAENYSDRLTFDNKSSTEITELIDKNDQIKFYIEEISDYSKTTYKFNLLYGKGLITELIKIDLNGVYKDTALNTQKDLNNELKTSKNKNITASIIVGSFGAESNAEKLKKSLLTEGFEYIDISKIGSVNRVSVLVLGSKEEAKEVLKKVKVNHKSAWISYN